MFVHRSVCVEDFDEKIEMRTGAGGSRIFFLSTDNLHKNHQHKNLVEKYIIVLLFALSLSVSSFEYFFFILYWWYYTLYCIISED